MNSLHELASRCEQALTGRQLPCGGWGYCGSRQWALEPTSLALLALRVRPGVGCSKAVHFLESCQRPDGSWPGFQEDEDGSWATALSVITLARLGRNWQAVWRGAEWLLKLQGQESNWLAKWRYPLFDRKVRFDPNKYGWPWIAGTSSWVVPTAFSLIALWHAFGCCLPETAKKRIEIGTAMLFDRGCPDGGWNAGNGVAFGATLAAHIDVTSLALLALFPVRNHPFVKTSLSWLRNQKLSEHSTYTLCWAAIALAAYGCDTLLAAHTLARLDLAGPVSQDPEATALVLLALQALRGANPFGWPTVSSGNSGGLIDGLEDDGFQSKH
jgi:hypothetical protein